MTLSKGFINLFLAGENSEGLTPILQIEKFPMQEFGVICFLTDGESSLQFAFKNDSGPRENIEVGVRVILYEYYLSNNRQRKIGMVKRFELYTGSSLIPAAICPSPSPSIQTSTKGLNLFPRILDEFIVTSRICIQSSFLLNRMADYFRQYFIEQNQRRAPVVETVSVITGINKGTVLYHLKKPPSPTFPRCCTPKKRFTRREKWEKVAQKYEPFVQDKIRRLIYHKYRNELPVNIQSLITELGQQLSGDDIDFNPSLTQMRLLLKGMGFRYEKIRGKPQIYENKAICESRQKFLRTIRQFREQNVELIWMDETWVFEGMLNQYGWVCQEVKGNPLEAYHKHHTTGPKPPSNRGRRAIVVGAMDSNKLLMDTCKIFRGGYVEDGDYHRQMNAEIFEDWLVNAAPHFLREAGQKKIVLVLDNAPYHSRKRNKIPTKSSSKQQMIDFLEKYGVHTPAGLRKPEVFDFLQGILQKNPAMEGIRVVEEICHNFGIEVLRLPPYHCIFNPIENIWSILKSNLRKKCTSKSKIGDVIALGMQCLAEISNDNVKKCADHSKKIEEWFMEQEGTQDAISPFIIELDDDDDNNDWLEESDEETENEDEEIDVVS